jgi:hypothetical protein
MDKDSFECLKYEILDGKREGTPKEWIIAGMVEGLIKAIAEQCHFENINYCKQKCLKLITLIYDHNENPTYEEFMKSENEEASKVH